MASAVVLFRRKAARLARVYRLYGLALGSGNSTTRRIRITDTFRKTCTISTGEGLALIFRWKMIVLFVLLGLLAVSPTPGQEDEIAEETLQPTEEITPGVPELPETMVEAELSGQEVSAPTRTARPLEQVASSTTIVTGEQLQDQNFTLVAEALRSVPGVDVVRAGPTGGQTSLFLRGANSQHTKVLIDGIPVNDPSNASRSFDFSALAVDEIERIEVVRGPQSTLYGTDAIGGVVSIVTKRGQGPLSVQAYGEGGSFGTHREGIRASGGTECYHYSIGGSFYQADGFSAAAERLGNVEDDGFRLGTVSSRFGWTPADSFDVDCVVRWTDSRAELDDASFSLGQPPTDDPRRLYLTNQLFSRIQTTWRMLDDAIEQKVSFNVSDYDRTDTDDEFPTDFAGRTLMFDWQSNLHLTCNNLLVVGVDYLDESASSFAPFGFPPFADASQDKTGIYVEDQFQLGERWFNTVGFRWDEWNTAGSADTYRLTSLYRIDETGTALHGTIGTGFRAPSLAENLFPFGNPNLLPERSKGWDVGATQQLVPDQLIVDVTYFRNDIQDLILFDLATFTLENIGQARTHGVEVTGRWHWSDDTLVTANYTRTDTLDLDTGSPLVRRPRDKGNVSIGHYFLDRRAYADLNAWIVGQRTDSRDGSVTLPGYAVINLAGYYNVTDRMQLFSRIDNLFNRQYEQITGYSTGGFLAVGGVRCTW